MKKLLLSSLLAAVGLLMGTNNAFADCDLEDGGWYYIKSVYKNTYVNFSNLPYENSTPQELQVVQQSSGKWYITDGTKYLAASTWNSAASSTPVAWTIEGTQAEGYYITTTSADITHYGYFGPQDGKTKFYTNNGTGDNCKFEFILQKSGTTKFEVIYQAEYEGETFYSKTYKVDADAAFPEPTGCTNPFIQFTNVPTGTVTQDTLIELTYISKYACFTDAASITQWYALDIHGNEGDYPVYAKTEDDIMYAYNNVDASLSKRRVADGTADDYQSGAVMNDLFVWGFIGDPFDGVKLYNKGKGAYVYFNGVPAGVSDRTQAPATFVATAAEASVFKPINTTAAVENAFCLQNEAATETTGKNILNQKNYLVSGYEVADGGSAMRAWAINYTAGNVARTMNAIYGTLIVPFYAAIPEGIEVYSCASASDKGVLNLVAETAIYPNVPYIIKGTAGTAYNFTSATTGNYVDAATKGLLTGVYVATEVDAPNYVLQNNGGNLGFYQVAAGEEPTVQANRCYVTLDDPSVKVLYFDEETGIKDVNVDADVNAIYNLAGQRINQMQKGINIVNGKKVLK